MIKDFHLPNIEILNQVLRIDAIIKLKEVNINSDISELDNQIDELVYQLYDLTAAEIAIIESSTK